MPIIRQLIVAVLKHTRLANILVAFLHLLHKLSILWSDLLEDYYFCQNFQIRQKIGTKKLKQIYDKTFYSILLDYLLILPFIRIVIEYSFSVIEHHDDKEIRIKMMTIFSIYF